MYDDEKVAAWKAVSSRSATKYSGESGWHSQLSHKPGRVVLDSTYKKLSLNLVKNVLNFTNCAFFSASLVWARTCYLAENGACNDGAVKLQAK